MKHRSKGKVWLYSGEKAAWHFITLSKTLAEKMGREYKRRRGWGSIPVKVIIGKTAFSTSVFPDKASGSFLLPLNAKVRKREQIEVGKTCTFDIEVDRFRP